MKRLIVFTIVCIGFFFPPAAVQADKAAAGWQLAQSAGGSVNPLGLELGTRLYYQLPLFPALGGPLWDSARVEAGLHNSLTPAYDNLSAFLRIEPVAVFDLHLSAGVRGCYDILGFGYTPMPGYDASFSPKVRADLDRESGLGFRYSVSPTLKGAAGSFLFATSTSFVLFDMRGLPDGAGDYFYEPAADTILKRTDFFISNDTVLLHRFRDDILGGVSHYFLFVPGSEYVSERLALIGILSRTLRSGLTGTLAVLGGTYIRDRHNSYRDGKVYAALQAGLTLKLE
jgi:hypothetical protein